MCLNINTAGGRNIAVSGQVGKKAPAHVWDCCTGERIRGVRLPQNCREVSACAISSDGCHIATADKSNDHVVTIWDQEGNQVMSDKGGPDHIFDLAFNKDTSKVECWSAGVKHLAFWSPEKGKKKKGIYGQAGDQTSHAAITADD